MSNLNPAVSAPPCQSRAAEFRTLLEELLPESPTPETATAERLGLVMAPLACNAAGLGQSIQVLRERLLDLTLRESLQRVPHYRACLPRPLRGSYALEDLPTIDRETVRDQRDQLLDPTTELAFISFTSGTTQGTPLMIERSVEEQTFIRAFLDRMNRTLPTRTGPRPLRLSIEAHNHGEVFQQDGAAMTFRVDQRMNGGFFRAAWLLTQDFEFADTERRISQITGAFGRILCLVRYLRQEKITIAPGQIRSIETFADYVPRHQRAEVEAFFGATVDDTYSMTEIFGGANYFAKLDGYLFNPWIIDELLDPHRDEMSLRGPGEVVLTTLYPFCQRFPLLRYRTGDLAIREPISDIEGVFAYRFLGRIRNCGYLEACDSWLGSAQVVDVLDPIPEVCRDQDPTAQELEDRTAGETVDFQLDADERGLHLRVPVVFDPRSFPHRAEELASQIRAGLVAEAVPTLQNHLLRHPDHLAVSLLSPAAFRKSGDRSWYL